MNWIHFETHIELLHGFLKTSSVHLSFQEPNEGEDEDEDEDPNPPMMVPMADMLNHVSNHNANLEYTPVSLTYTSC